MRVIETSTNLDLPVFLDKHALDDLKSHIRVVCAGSGESALLFVGSDSWAGTSDPGPETHREAPGTTGSTPYFRLTPEAGHFVVRLPERN